MRSIVSALCACAVCPALYVGSLGCLVISILVNTAQRASNRVNKPTQTIVVQLVLRHNALWRIPIPVVSDTLLAGAGQKCVFGGRHRLETDLGLYSM
ncbi:hypothetical protein EDB86DRAFT_2917632 [Lactarius hatsudake]|nr:hypothetical protein EDB86DRAFT_2983682 [Lactarius hatsudake]KAH8997037.1 hypothetical protein EDB86DRAFT_2917632 [Lactarius hatsudake]